MGRKKRWVRFEIHIQDREVYFEGNRLGNREDEQFLITMANSYLEMRGLPTIPPRAQRQCKDCGRKTGLVAINTKPEYVCGMCWDLKGYEYDPTPW